MTETIQRLDCNPHVLNHRNLDLLTTPLVVGLSGTSYFFENTRTNNALSDAGIKYVGQIYTLGEEEILRTRGIGPLGLSQLKERLANEGVPFIPNSLPKSISDTVPRYGHRLDYWSDAPKFREQLEEIIGQELNVCEDFAKSLLPPEKQTASPDFLRAVYFAVQDQLPDVDRDSVNINEIERDFYEF
ncbi:MAG: hypothetical protein ACK5II_11225 [Paracoccus sp. (in: a-proteobacteria)]